MDGDNRAPWSLTVTTGTSGTVSPDEIETACRTLWETAVAPDGAHPPARTHVLVAVGRKPCDAEALTSAALRHPGRYVDAVVGAAADAARVDLLASPGGFPLSEKVQLSIGSAAHWAEAILPLLPPDVPMQCWVTDPGLIHDPEFQQLLDGMDMLILDTGPDTAPAAAWRPVMARRSDLGIGDLAWTRILPWRQALAGLFDEPAHRDWLPGLTGITATGGANAAGEVHWLAAWIAARIRPAHGALTVGYQIDPTSQGLGQLVLVFSERGVSATATRTERGVGATLSRGDAVLATAVGPALTPPEAALADTLARGFDPLFRQALDHLLAELS
jgi:glucose-6-phosphate dehydrogenase assembly protein OpcA